MNEIINLSVGIASILLAVIAIAQAIYYYTQSKNTEARVQIALVAIKAQTDTLQAINARTLDRLTKYVTTPRDDATQAVQLLITTLPDIVLKLMPPTQTNTIEALQRELIHAYIAIWNYTANANVWAGFSLPPLQEFNDQESYHRAIKYIIDRSAADFNYMTGIINQLTPQQINICVPSYIALYNEVHNILKPLVGDTTQHYAKRSQQI